MTIAIYANNRIDEIGRTTIRLFDIDHSLHRKKDWTKMPIEAVYDDYSQI